jgi:hypothetical protein
MKNKLLGGLSPPPLNTALKTTARYLPKNIKNVLKI